MKSFFRKTSQLFLIAALFLLTQPARVSYAASIVVNTNADNATGGDGFCTLREAITNANADSDSSSGDCTAGSGADTITFSISGTIALTSVFPSINTEMVIDGSGQSILISGSGSHIGFIIDSTGDLTLKKITINNGKAGSTGGGIHNSGKLTLMNSTISRNAADSHGGGIYNGGTATITGSSISGNTSNGAHGGGIYNGGTLNISDSTLSGNTSMQAKGGGIYNAGTLEIENSTFSSNTAASEGGGISNHFNLKITNSTFSSNNAIQVLGSGPASSNGGAITNFGGLEITNSTFSGNSVYVEVAGGATDSDAYAYGGAIYSFGSLTISNSTFSQNAATAKASGETAATGGALYSASSGTVISNSTFSDNTVSADQSFPGAWGGAISSSGIMKNSIFSNNTGGDCAGPFSADAYNLDTDGSCDNATQKTVGEIGLGTLADNGGATKTMAIDNTSAAYNAGDNSTCEAKDQRGIARPQNTTCDVGAYEVDSTAPTVISTSLASSYSSPGPTSFTVIYSENVNDGGNGANNDDVTNPANYLLVEAGSNGVFNTTACDAGTVFGVQPDDTQITVNNVTYDENTYTATVNLSTALQAGKYRLFVCGTTSILDLSNLLLNGGTDSTYDFTVSTPSNLPATGFRHGRVTQLPHQPAARAYASTAMTLEIPKLGISTPIVGVPQSESGWDVTWLGNSAGYLAGSAFPTWAGNTVITGHVWDAFNQPGIFAEIKNLKYGDQVQIHAWGVTYTYEVRESKLVTKKNVDAAFQSEEYDWVTLVTLFLRP